MEENNNGLANNEQLNDNIASSDFQVEKTVLKKYLGKDNHVLVPDGITVIGDGAFKNHKEIISITLPDNIIAIGHYSFFGCKKLTSIELPDTLTSIGNFSFKGCKNLPVIDIPESVRKIGRGAFDSTAMLIH